MTDPVLITSAAEPVTLGELKDHLGIGDGEVAPDMRLSRQLARARRAVESATGIGLASETWEQAFDAAEVTVERLRLHRTPVTAIVSVIAKYADGTTGTMAAASYYAIRDGIARASGVSWPGSLRTYEALVVRYVAGEVPIEGSGLREAVLKLAASYDAHRGDDEFASSIMAMPPDIEALLAPYRPVWVG